VQEVLGNSKPFGGLQVILFATSFSCRQLYGAKSKSKASRLTALMICLKRLWPSLRTIRLRGLRANPIVST